MYHFDVYRITNSEDLFEIGADEYFYGKGVCIVEWVDCILEVVPEDTWFISITYGEEENEMCIRDRHFTFYFFKLISAYMTYRTFCRCFRSFINISAYLSLIHI